MPRFVGNAVGIFARERQVKSEGGGALRKPGEGGREREACGERRVVGRGDINGAAGVVFAETGGGDEGENFIEGASGGEMGADDRGLARDAAEARYRNQREAVALGGGVQPLPRGRGGSSEPEGAVIFGLPTDANESGWGGFAKRTELTGAAVVEGDAEGAMEGAETGGGHDEERGAAR